MLYHIRKIDEDTIEHIIDGKSIGKEISITHNYGDLESLRKHLQEWVDQRKEFFALTKVTNDFGVDLKL